MKRFEIIKLFFIRKKEMAIREATKKDFKNGFIYFLG